jgi:hypothetical protein
MQNQPVFPPRYYIIDFEFSIRLPEKSDPVDHPDDYGREIASDINKPHCPFESDIFQLRKMFFDHFHVSPASFYFAYEIDSIAASGARLS